MREVLLDPKIMSENKLPVAPDSAQEDHYDDEEYARNVIEKWDGPIPTTWDDNKLKYFKAVEHKPEITALARGLTIEEALNYYGLVPSVLPEYDALYFVTTFLRGRMKAKNDAVNHLFQNMSAVSGNQGLQASLAYLNRFAKTFKNTEGNADAGVKAIKIEVIE